jgi:hypothetical protein
MTADFDVRPLLCSLRLRVTAQALARNLGVAALSAGGALILLAAADRWSATPLWRWQSVTGVLLVALLWGCVATWRGRLPLPALAGLLDHLGGTHDRLLTAFAFSEAVPVVPVAAPSAAMRTLALRECSAYVARTDFLGLLPWRLPRECRWLFVPLVMVALLRWDAGEAAVARRLAAEAGRARVAPTVRSLQALARQVEKAGDSASAEERKRLSELIAESAKKLDAGARNPVDAEKSALSALSELEQMVQEMQRQPENSLSPEQQSELAKALEQQKATEEAGQALSQGDMDAAAKLLEDAAKKLSQAGEQPNADQAEAALRRALERLAEQKKLSEALDRLRQMAQQSGGASSESLRQLAQLLRQLPQSSDKKQNGSKGAQQNLQNILAALQNMKSGQSEDTPGPSSEQKGENQGPSMLQIGPPNGQGDVKVTEASAPSGQPGSEHDEGTTDGVYGKEKNDPIAKGADLALQGRQSGQGKSFSQVLPGALDSSKAKRQYKALYEAMAPAAEDAVQQENIPLGSRLLIKRYFEAIRPKE